MTFENATPEDAYFIDQYWLASGDDWLASGDDWLASDDDWAIPEFVMIAFGRAMFTAGAASVAQPDEGRRYPLVPTKVWLEDGKIMLEARMPDEVDTLAGTSIEVSPTIYERPQTDRDRHRTQGYKTREEPHG